MSWPRRPSGPACPGRRGACASSRPRSRAAVLLLAILAAAAPAAADTVTFKNGREVEGIVKSDDGREVVLDIGYGTVTFQRSEIRSIRRSSAGERGAVERGQRRKAWDSGRWTPKGAEGLLRGYREVRRLREKALDARTRARQVDEEGAKLQEELARVRRRRASVGESLQAATPAADPARYNALVAEFNGLAAQADAAEARLRELPAEAREASEEMRLYIEAFRAFEDEAKPELERLAGRGGQAGGGAAQDDQARDFFDGMRSALAEMGKDVLEERAASRGSGPHVVVEAMLDRKVLALLLVDTGATHTTITRSVAGRLAAARGPGLGEAEFRLADGRQVKAKMVLLDSVSVGKARAERVPVAVIAADDLGQGVDGLLGMSFLSRFSFRLDTEANRLILQSLK